MTGTSLDAVDIALLETDGEAVLAWGPVFEAKLAEDVRRIVRSVTQEALANDGAVVPARLARAEQFVTQAHLDAARSFFRRRRVDPSSIDFLGIHGQTIFHLPPTANAVGRTQQIVDAQGLADSLGLPVCYDFRSADMAGGGQGAPLTPVYHRALVSTAAMRLPVAVLNLGGVANITHISPDGSITAFDTGPANGMLDQLMQERTGRRADIGGLTAAAGTPDFTIVDRYLTHPYFVTPGPRSLDRYAFSLDAVGQLSLVDAAATLTHFAARAVGAAIASCVSMPLAVIIAGGGRLNPTLVTAIRHYSPVPIQIAEDQGWRGDSIEAEAFAMLAARTMRGLPISFPSTTGVDRPMRGGRVAYPRGLARIPLHCRRDTSQSESCQ